MSASVTLQESVKTILSDLVAFDTISENSNLALMGYVQEIFERHGVKPVLRRDESKQKANLIARIGPADREDGFLFSGHTDTVSFGNMDNWRSHPLKLTNTGDGRLVARGSTDMKGAIACFLAQVPLWTSVKLERPIDFVLSRDEERGCNGIDDAVEELEARGAKPRLGVVGEPTNGKVGDSHFLRANVICRCNASGLHPSTDNDTERTNALEVVAAFIEAVRQRKPELSKVLAGRLPAAMTATILKTSTAQRNEGPDGAEALIDLRARAWLGQQEIEDQFRPIANAVFQDFRSTKTGRLDLELLIEITNPGFTSQFPHAVDTAKAVMETSHVIGLPYVCEAANMQKKYPVIICGPGDILQAHQPNEWISEAELYGYAERVERNVTRFLTAEAA